jgi:hypothetical protein
MVDVMLIGFAMMTMGVAALVTIGATVPLSFGNRLDFGQLALVTTGEDADVSRRL